jgi:hypothetical protein
LRRGVGIVSNCSKNQSASPVHGIAHQHPFPPFRLTHRCRGRLRFGHGFPARSVVPNQLTTESRVTVGQSGAKRDRRSFLGFGHAIRRVEPRAWGLSERPPEDYSWSSAIGHLGSGDATGLLNLGLVPRLCGGAVGRRFGRRLRGIGNHSRKYPPWQTLGHKRSCRRTGTPTPGRVTA